MVTIKEIAKMAKVSTATVSYVLNDPSRVSEETREKVMKIVKKFNYNPNSIAKSLKIKKTNTIGIITEDVTVFTAPEIIDGIEEYAENRNYHIILNNIRLFKRIGNQYKDTAKFAKVIADVTNVLTSRQVEGIIYVGAHCRDVTGVIGDISIPVAYTYCYTTADVGIAVNYNDEAAACRATEYLITKKHQKIGIITGRMDSMQTHDRLKGYQKALYEQNLLFNPQYMKVGDWERESGYRAGKELLSLPDPPTAIFAMNDLMAGGVIDAANEAGLHIPQDLSLVGFDNRECSYSYTPKLSTMALPLNEMGKICAQKLIDRINNRAGNRQKTDQVKLQCELIERDSVSLNRREGI